MDDQVVGIARQGLGRMQDAVGGLTGDAALQGKGKINEAAGAAQHAFGEAKSSLLEAVDDIVHLLWKVSHDVAQDVAHTSSVSTTAWCAW